MSHNKDNQAISSSAQGKWVGYWQSPIAGESELELPEQYAVLLVLDGEISFTFNQHDTKTIGEKSLIVIDRQQLTNCKWEANTAILEFTPPEKIFRFFASCSSAFQVPCSTIVPIRSKLQKWVDDLMAERLHHKEVLTNDRRREYCVRLGNILRSYPALQVGELLVPFHACSMSGEKKCKGEFCE